MTGLAVTGRVQFAAFLVDLRHYSGRRGVGAVAAMIAGAFAEGIGLAMLLPLLALLTGPGDGPAFTLVERAFGWLGVEGRFERLALVLGAFVVVMVARAAVLVWRDRMLMTLQVDFMGDLRARLLASMERARWSDLATLHHARVVQALGGDGDRVGAGTQTLLQIATAVAMLAAQWLLVLLLSPALALAAVILFLVAGAALLPTLRRAGRLGRGVASGRLTMAHGAGQLLGGLKAAKAQGTQAVFLSELATTGDQIGAQRLAFLRRTGLSRIVFTTAIALAGATMIVAGVWSGASPVALLATLAVFTRMTVPLMTIAQNAQFLSDQIPAHAATLSLIAELTQHREPTVTPRALPSRAPVRFEDVSYRHAQGVGVHGLTFALAPGEMVAVLGASGAGKTTLVDLLAGLLSPHGGAISIGTTALAAATLPAWRSRLAYIGQETFLTHDTLRRNLLVGAARNDDTAIAAALAVAGAVDLVAQLPDGLDTIVAERGMRLSGGERQRIALARALLRRPDLLILDEATNALDPASEQGVLARLAALTPRPTIVVVAHRGEALAMCDRTLTLDDGCLIAAR